MKLNRAENIRRADPFLMVLAWSKLHARQKKILLSPGYYNIAHARPERLIRSELFTLKQILKP